MPIPDPQRLLEVWEHGAQRHAIDRSLLLVALAEPDLAPEQLPDLPLGRCNAALMRLRQKWFGSPIPVWCDCPACGERMELSIDAEQLPAPPAGPSTEIVIEGLRFTAPTSRRLAAVVNETEPDVAARRLLASCADSPESFPEDPQLFSELLDAVDSALENADPWLDLSLDVQCPACGESSEPVLDIAGIVWEEVSAVAQQILDEVHLLARAYGWHEQDILAMSSNRRAAYLERLQP